LNFSRRSWPWMSTNIVDLASFGPESSRCDTRQYHPRTSTLPLVEFEPIQLKRSSRKRSVIRTLLRPSVACKIVFA
jgi:hypothetical protein